jgi:2-hydroxymuconate-semialdehyde hydrolase
MSAVGEAKDSVHQSRASAARKAMLQGVQLEGRRLDVGGVSTSVLGCGRGKPLVLLHGGIECGGVYWTPVIPQLAQSYRLIIPDVPGLGESDPVDRLDIDTFSPWFRSLLDLTCEQEKPALVAHSLLGSLAARFAARHAGILDRLVIYAAPGVGPYRMPLGLRVAAIVFALRPSERNAERFDRWAFADYNRARRQNGDWLGAFSEYTRYRAMVPHVKRTMRQLVASGTKRVPDDELRLINIPTALLWGRYDRFVPVALGEGTSQRLGWPIEIIDDAGHVPHIEQAEAFLNTLRATLVVEANS